MIGVQRPPLLFLIGILASSSIAACAPVLRLPTDTPRANLVISRTSPEVIIQQVVIDGRSIGTPQLSFDIPAGTHSVTIRFGVSVGDNCDPGDTRCPASVATGTCSGSFHSVMDGRYRILIDSRQEEVVGSVQERRVSVVYVGQDEHLVSPMTCEIIR